MMLSQSGLVCKGWKVERQHRTNKGIIVVVRLKGKTRYCPRCGKRSRIRHQRGKNV